jgi:aspartyl aminopeptidase
MKEERTMDQLTKNLRDFLDASPSVFHAVDNIAESLKARGADELDEKDPWALEPGATYFVKRGASSLIAFRPGLVSLGESGYILASAHTDSPGLKVRHARPNESHGMKRISVEVYGSPIVSGWLDRPLSIAGRVAVKTRSGIEERLYAGGKPIGIIPNLAIHLNRDINKGIEYSVHQHLPILVEIGKGEKENGQKQYPWVISRVAEDMEIDPASIVGAELFLFDSQKTVLFGGSGTSPESGAEESGNELINAARLDDLAGCHAILEAFMASTPAEHTQIACFLDAEEIGSMTAEGANSNFVRDMLARIGIGLRADAQDFYRAASRSLCLSLDVSQAWHPAYPEKFDEFYSPILGRGAALKINAMRNYATDLRSETLFSSACESIGVSWQTYLSRADIPPGKTIGPMTASHLGVLTLDIGHPLLSMHAIRETISSSDHAGMTKIVSHFFGENPNR